MASECEHAQSELTCIANKKKVYKYPSNIVLIALLLQDNKSFGAITICIHPLMYVKLCGNSCYTLNLEIQNNLAPSLKINHVMENWNMHLFLAHWTERLQTLHTVSL